MFTFSINGFKKFDLGNDDGTFDAIYFVTSEFMKLTYVICIWQYSIWASSIMAINSWLDVTDRNHNLTIPRM